MEALGSTMSASELKREFAQADLDGGGTISFNEFSSVRPCRLLLSPVLIHAVSGPDAGVGEAPGRPACKKARRA